MYIYRGWPKKVAIHKKWVTWLIMAINRGGWTRSEKAHGSKNRPIRNAEIEINN